MQSEDEYRTGSVPRGIVTEKHNKESCWRSSSWQCDGVALNSRAKT